MGCTLSRPIRHYTMRRVHLALHHRLHFLNRPMVNTRPPLLQAVLLYKVLREFNMQQVPRNVHPHPLCITPGRPQGSHNLLVLPVLPPTLHSSPAGGPIVVPVLVGWTGRKTVLPAIYVTTMASYVTEKMCLAPGSNVVLLSSEETLRGISSPVIWRSRCTADPAICLSLGQMLAESMRRIAPRRLNRFEQTMLIISSAGVFISYIHYLEFRVLHSIE